MSANSTALAAAFAQLRWRDPKLLAAAAGTTVREAREWLRGSDLLASAGAEYRRPAPQHYAPTGGHPGTYQADVVYLSEYAGYAGNLKRTCVLTLINANTRYAYARAMTNAKAASVEAALEDILEENGEDEEAYPSLLVTDGGSEWKGSVPAFFQRHGIRHFVAEANTHHKLARVDRFHRTLRALIGRLFQIRGSYVWVDALPDLIRAYNQHPHRALGGLSPEQATRADENLVRARDLARAGVVRKRTDARGIRPGDYVRYLANMWDVAATKGTRAQWSEPCLVVRRHGVNSFEIDAMPVKTLVAGRRSIRTPRIWPEHLLRKSQPPAAGAHVAAAEHARQRANELAQRGERQNQDTAEQVATRGPANPAAAPVGPRVRRKPAR